MQTGAQVDESQMVGSHAGGVAAAFQVSPAGQHVPLAASNRDAGQHTAGVAADAHCSPAAQHDAWPVALGCPSGHTQCSPPAPSSTQVWSGSHGGVQVSGTHCTGDPCQLLPAGQHIGLLAVQLPHVASHESAIEPDAVPPARVRVLTWGMTVVPAGAAAMDTPHAQSDAPLTGSSGVDMLPASFHESVPAGQSRAGGRPSAQVSGMQLPPCQTSAQLQQVGCPGARGWPSQGHWQQPSTQVLSEKRKYRAPRMLRTRPKTVFYQSCERSSLIR